MVKKQNIIKVKPIYVFFIIAFQVIGFIAVIKLSNRQAANYVGLDYEMKIDSTRIAGNEGYGSLRGAIFFKKGYYIPSSAKLVENRCNYNNWVSNGPIIDFDTIPHKYSLDDLGFPYIVFKNANNDTLNVVKEGCQLKFVIE